MNTELSSSIITAPTCSPPQLDVAEYRDAHSRRTGRAMNPPQTLPPVVVATARYVLLPLANLITGYTVKAMQRKIERGDWVEGRVWRHAPDGRILIDVQGYQRWVEGP